MLRGWGTGTTQARERLHHRAVALERDADLAAWEVLAHSFGAQVFVCQSG